MKQLLVVGFIILFVGAGIIPSTIGINETKLMNLGSRGYIQRLINNASNGDTIYIPAGTYYENIIISKSISLFGEDKNTTIIDGGNSGDVVRITADWVNISGFTIQNSGTDWWNDGIYIRENYGTISDTIVTNNNYGINIYGNAVTIKNNIISSNIRTGVSLWYGEDNILEGNTIHSNWRGIQLHLSDFNIVVNNSITNNALGILLQGYCDYNTIIGNNISNNSDGICIIYSKKNTITANTISHNHNDGLSLNGAVRNIVANNLISDNVNGIHLNVGIAPTTTNRYNSKDNVIMKNTFLGNSRTAFFAHKLPIEDGGYNNTWQQNYWNKPRIAPKIIFGRIRIVPGIKRILIVPWINFDWHPAQEPYHIKAGI